MNTAIKNRPAPSTPTHESKRRRRGPWAALMIAALFAATLAAVSAPAAANWSGASGNTGCSGGVNMTDNKDLYYYRSSLTSYMYSAVAHALNNEVAPTDIVVKPEESSAGSGTDIVYYDADFSTWCGKDWHPDDPSDAGTAYVWGNSSCETLSGSKCDRNDIRFDTSYWGSASTNARRKVACHETGHALGLTHRSGSCMVTGSTWNTFFSSHDENHLDSNY